ncbi:putative ankyrin repeat protein RF_0381 [Stegodyphus dumicola]|uniref:putative ankyrin repeat protein RF_0381 n=1 Tax=Stegodyphus dumicola TaxID=202533 RepID=UPI0015B26B9A|nr:putative ankyrin repeat protein RF_0381 [Stegodyphus dumicola]
MLANENFPHPDGWRLNYNVALGNILLHLAASISGYELTRLLLEKGADVESIDKEGRTALHIACEQNCFGNVNYACRVWTTPLIAAADKLLDENSTTNQDLYLDLCMLLIERGCNVNDVNNQAETALHIAVKAKKESLVQKLLISGNSGANLKTQDLETTLEKWKIFEVSNEKSIQLLKYANYKSKQCRTLGNLCTIAIRKIFRNVEKDAVQLGLPQSLVVRLKDLKTGENVIGICKNKSNAWTFTDFGHFR